MSNYIFEASLQKRFRPKKTKLKKIRKRIFSKDIGLGYFCFDSQFAETQN